MKKFLIIFVLLLSVTGCGGNTAKGAVDNYLKKYRNLDSEVLIDLEKIVDKETLTKEEQEKYREVLKKQYKDLSFEVIEEEYDNDISYVTVKVNVYDLYKAQSNAYTYLLNNPDEFYNENNEYDENKYIDYKLEEMKNMNDKVEYKITFTVTKEDDKYVVELHSEETLQKIHGIYNYEMN